MITSIIPLPEFASPGTVINGKISGGIYGDDMSDIPELDSKGRDIRIDPGYAHKYKVRFTDPIRMKEYTVVMMSLFKLNLANINENAGSDIYPIYLREYDLGGAINRLPSNAILSVEGISRFLRDYGNLSGQQFDNVVSVASAVRHVCDRLGIENYECLPKYFRENMYDQRFGTLAPNHENLADLVFNIDDGSRYAMETVGDFNCILQGYLPFTADTILRITRVEELARLLDPCYRTDTTFMGICESMKSWGVYYSWIHEKDDSCPRYVDRSDNDAMSNILFYSSTLNATDYEIKCVPPSISQKSGMRFNAYRFQMMKDETDFAKLSRFGESVREQLHLDFNYAEVSCCTAIGSCLEDILVYNTAGELIAYIDLVWWIIARGAGLLNEHSTLI